MWYKKADDADFKYIDPEEDWEEAEQSERIFNEQGFRLDRNKNFHQVAIEDGIVIGTIASGWSKNNDYGEDVMVFSFDLVVKPDFRKKGIGLRLIQDAIQKYNQEKLDYQEMGNKTMMRIWVVNPILIPVLEKLGFTIESTYEIDSWGNPGSAHLIAY